jgi:hypothetical protein
LKTTLELLKKMKPEDRRKFEIYFSKHWLRGDDLSFARKSIAWFVNIMQGILTKPFRS